jgi:leucyl-tRNA synthetase
LPEADKEESYAKLHKTIKKVTEEMSNFKYNTAIASLMEFVNFIEKKGSDSTVLKSLSLLLAPFAPHMMEEVWVEKLHQPFSIHKAQWPVYDPKYINKSEAVIVVQVNGKLRSQFTITNLQFTKDQIEDMAKKDPNVIKWLKGKTIKRTIFIPGKLINFVV